MTNSTSVVDAFAVRAVDATKVYGEGAAAVVALDHVSIDIPEGCFTVIMGPSGSGKSTLLQCLAGLDELTSGEVFVGDLSLLGASDGELTALRRESVGFIFQAFNLLPTLSALENILLPSSLAQRRPDPAWVDEVIEAMGLGDRLDHRPSEMSGGQQQRVAIARALVSRPRVIFADEPTGNLDSESGTDVLEKLAGAVSELGQTVVMVTHDTRAAAFGDVVVFMSDGHLVDRIEDPTEAKVLDRLKSLS
jgi:putative ABC transport system ATP-binding protein